MFICYVCIERLREKKTLDRRRSILRLVLDSAVDEYQHLKTKVVEECLIFRSAILEIACNFRRWHCLHQSPSHQNSQNFNRATCRHRNITLFSPTRLHRQLHHLVRAFAKKVCLHRTATRLHPNDSWVRVMNVGTWRYWRFWLILNSLHHTPIAHITDDCSTSCIHFYSHSKGVDMCRNCGWTDVVSLELNVYHWEYCVIFDHTEYEAYAVPW